MKLCVFGAETLFFFGGGVSPKRISGESLFGFQFEARVYLVQYVPFNLRLVCTWYSTSLSTRGSCVPGTARPCTEFAALLAEWQDVGLVAEWEGRFGTLDASTRGKAVQVDIRLTLG